MGSSLKPKNEVISPDETMRIMEAQQRWNNPNVSNMFGSTTTTFGPDGQPQIVQDPSDEMRGMIEQQQAFAQAGPAQLNLQQDQNAQNMMNQFNSRVGQRAGFAPPMGVEQMGNLGTPQFQRDPSAPPSLPSSKPPMTMRDNDPNNGVPIGDGSTKPNIMEKLKQFQGNMNGENEVNSLARALMDMRKIK